MQAHEMQAHEMQAYKVHAHEGGAPFPHTFGLLLFGFERIDSLETDIGKLIVLLALESDLGNI